MRTKKIPEVLVQHTDFILPTSTRSYVRGAQEIINQFLEAVPAPTALRHVAGWASQLLNAPYHDDLTDISAATGISKNTLVLANCSYELSPFGCTTRVDEHRGLLRVRRTLDWAIPSLGNHSRVVRNPDAGYTNVTFPGFVGAATAMRDGQYAVVVNAAPASKVRWGWQPLMLVRWTIENCATYDEAVYTLQNTKLINGIFFTVVGTDAACVIERTGKDARIRRFRGQPLVVANHYRHKDFLHINDDVGDSPIRVIEFENSAAAWLSEPILNDTTVQSVELTPSKGHCVATAHAPQ